MVKGAWSIKPLASNSEVKELSILERRNSYVSFKNKMREHWDNMWAHDLEGDFPELVPLQPLAKLLSPMLLSMSVCGLFHLTDEIIADDPKHRFKYRIAFIMGKAMSFLMLVFCWVIVAINAYHFPYEEFSFNHKVFSYIVYVAWFFQNAISVTCCFVACFRKKLYRKLFKKWADICFPENIAKQINRYCVVIQWSFVVICWMSIVIVVAGSCHFHLVIRHIICFSLSCS